MMTAEGFAPAKINLTLHVTGQRADGYHLLDSLVVFADLGDRLWYRPGVRLSLEVVGPFAKGVPTDARNLVWRAAEAAGWTGHIRLEKTLPHGAGIGGGSSDAAAVLRDLGAVASCAPALGADVAVCLSSVPQRMQGIGEVVRAVHGVPTLDMVLVNPGGTVATPAVFRALAKKSNPPMQQQIPEFQGYGDFLSWLAGQRNDLELPALTCAPQIVEALASLKGADLARMSGSGGTCFGVFPNAGAAREAALRISARYPSWWVRTCRTVPASAGPALPNG